MRILKLSLLLIVTFALSFNANAAVKPTETESKAKAADAPEMNGDWFKYIEDAKAESDKTGKPILANFTGSDWCGWCIRLKKEVFVTPEFQKWAKENVVLLELDFPRRTPQEEALKAQNSSLQQAFKVRGFPTLWAFNLNFNQDTEQFNINALGSIGYVAGGPEKWIEKTNEILNNK